MPDLSAISKGLIYIAISTFFLIAACTVVRADNQAAEIQSLEMRLRAVGNPQAISAPELYDVAKGFELAGTSHLDAIAMARQIALSGNVTLHGGDELGRLSIDTAAGKGLPVQYVMARLLDTAGRGYPAIKQLDSEWNFLTTTQYSEIRSLAEKGQQRAAFDVMLAALHKRFDGLRKIAP